VLLSPRSIDGPSIGSISLLSNRIPVILPCTLDRINPSLRLYRWSCFSTVFIMVVTIGVFVGNLSNANVQRVVSNHGWMLGERFNLDLITTSPENYDTHHYRDKVGDQFSQSSHGAIRALNHYHSEYQPDVIYHTNRPPIHGGLVTALGKRTDTTTVFRYPGDTFQLYRVAEGWKKIPFFCSEQYYRPTAARSCRQSCCPRSTRSRSAFARCLTVQYCHSSTGY